MLGEARELFDLPMTVELNPVHAKYIQSNPYFANHRVRRVPLQELVNSIDHSTLQDRENTWPQKHTQYMYDPDKDTNPSEAMHATYNPRTKQYKIGNGRHRIQALYNAGYTHIDIPILEEK